MDALGSILGGTFSGCAFFATLFLLAREVRLRRAEQQAALLREDDENARQARLIVSAITNEAYPLNANLMVLELEGTISNYSDMPIFNLIVQLEDVGTGGDGFRMLKPGESVRSELHVRRPADSGPADLYLPRKIGLSLHFLDANGRHWHRKGSGQPRRVLSGALSERVPIERYRPEGPAEAT
ncbi:hypothetical protein [Nocardia sp. NRRL S-836]|uniref:hypothetical protein n=1 Tax=Nocardia sp. NRRL S-836 TaxID=1519492 RepID=UPI0012FA48EE|nr:hypothetical protein [Nocardia sp. NRRL S-836]